MRRLDYLCFFFRALPGNLHSQGLQGRVTPTQLGNRNVVNIATYYPKWPIIQINAFSLKRNLKQTKFFLFNYTIYEVLDFIFVKNNFPEQIFILTKTNIYNSLILQKKRNAISYQNVYSDTF